jgi:hypothetical protein
VLRPAATGGVGGFAAGEPAPGVTPTGLEIFLALGLPVWPAESELDVLRGAAPAAPEILDELVAPMETPTGREAPIEVLPDGEEAMPALCALRDEPPLAPEVPLAAGVPAEVTLAGALPAACGAPPVDFVISLAEAATEELALPTPAMPGAVADPVPRAMAGPLVPSVRGGAFGSETPRSTSGSSNSADANESVGISADSGGTCGTDALEAVEMDEAGGTSGPESSSTPYASRSSSEFIGSFGAGCGEEAGGLDAAGPVEEEGRALPPWDAVPFNPKGSSTGRSAKGSKAGREAASIVFEPDSGDQS